MSQLKEAAELQEMTTRPGWAHFLNILEELSKDAENELIGMFSRPETLTGKKAIRLAAKREAFLAIKEEVDSRIKILLPIPKRDGA